MLTLRTISTVKILQQHINHLFAKLCVWFLLSSLILMSLSLFLQRRKQPCCTWYSWVWWADVLYSCCWYWVFSGCLFCSVLPLILHADLIFSYSVWLRLSMCFSCDPVFIFWSLHCRGFDPPLTFCLWYSHICAERGR